MKILFFGIMLLTNVFLIKFNLVMDIKNTDHTGDFFCWELEDHVRVRARHCYGYRSYPSLKIETLNIPTPIYGENILGLSKQFNFRSSFYLNQNLNIQIQTGMIPIIQISTFVTSSWYSALWLSYNPLIQLSRCKNYYRKNVSY